MHNFLVRLPRLDAYGASVYVVDALLDRPENRPLIVALVGLETPSRIATRISHAINAAGEDVPPPTWVDLQGNSTSRTLSDALLRSMGKSAKHATSAQKLELACHQFVSSGRSLAIFDEAHLFGQDEMLCRWLERFAETTKAAILCVGRESLVTTLDARRRTRIMCKLVVALVD